MSTQLSYSVERTADTFPAKVAGQPPVVHLGIPAIMKNDKTGSHPVRFVDVPHEWREAVLTAIRHLDLTVAEDGTLVDLTRSAR